VEGSGKVETSIIKSIETTEENITFRLSGDLDYATSAGTRTDIDRACLTGPPVPIVLDLRHVRHVDSTGIALIIHCHKLRDESQELTVLVSSPSQPERILVLGKFNTIFTLTSTDLPRDVADAVPLETDLISMPSAA
jgi:anti-anti-sigma factor